MGKADQKISPNVESVQDHADMLAKITFSPPSITVITYSFFLKWEMRL